MFRPNGLSLRTGMRAVILTAVSILLLLGLAGCGGGGESSPPPAASPPPVTNHTVTLAWTSNHETGVNSAGGGYHVAISGQPTIDVPFTSAPTAPTSTVTSLQTGTYTVTVTAFAALDTQGGSAGSLSALSQSLTVVVP
jgi:predicted small lipoprotein YifL